MKVIPIGTDNTAVDTQASTAKASAAPLLNLAPATTAGLAATATAAPQLDEASDLLKEELEEDVDEYYKEEAEPSPAEPESVQEIQTEKRANLASHYSLFRALWALAAALFWTSVYTIDSSIRYLIRHPLHFLLDIVLLTLLTLVAITGVEVNNQLILDKISDKTVSDIIKSSRFTREYNAEESDRNPAREFLRVGAPVWIQKESVRAILFFARKAGLAIEDQAVLLAIADIESGFNPFGRAPTTTACGIFQFVRATGEFFRLSPKVCMDPWENARAGVDHYIRNFEQRVVEQVSGLTGAERVFRTFELSYYFHHDGIESGNPNTEVKAIILSGTQFLFRSYHILQDEMRSQVQATSFSEKFATNVWKFLDRLLDYYHSTQLSKFFSDGDPEAQELEAASES